MSITKSERVLIVLNHIASGSTDYLYRFIEAAGKTTVATILGDDYAQIVKLYGKNATLVKLINALKTQGGKAGVKRIDLIINLHGAKGKIVFFDGVKKSSDVRLQIQALKIKSKLRLVYSTCCWGNTHSKDFIDAGFDAAIGSIKVNANAAVEFAPLLSLWQYNAKLSDCLAPTILPTPAADTAAKAYGAAYGLSWCKEVDSTKVIKGNSNIKITT